MVVVILIIGLSISACNFQGDEALFDLGGGAPVVNSCSGETDCHHGETCYEGICVTREMQPLIVTLEIAPPFNEVSPSKQSDSNATFRNQQTGEIEPAVAVVPPFIVKGPAKRRRFEVPLLVEISGKIRYEGARVPAKITFIPIDRPDNINAIRTITAITTEEPVWDSKGKKSDYIAHVLQNVYYTAIVQPIADPEQPIADPEQPIADPELVAELPPVINTPFIAVLPTGRPFDVEYTGINFLPRSFSLSLPDSQNDMSLDVFAVSSDNPDILVSSWSTIGDGRFSLGGNFTVDLNFFPYIDFFDLIISPFVDRSDQASSEATERSKTPIWPIFTVGGFDLENSAQTSNDSETNQPSDEIEIELPAVQQPITFSGYVELCADATEFSIDTSNMDLPVSFYSKQLFVNPDQTGIEGSFSTRTNTLHDSVTGGLASTVELLPGRYEVVVSPPLDGPCEVYAKEIEIGITSETRAENRFQLVAKTFIRGTLKTAKGEPIVGATIDAQALNRDGIDRSDNPTIMRFNRSNQTTTDENGRYDLAVDRGSYDIIARPPAASHYGWKVVTDVAIDNRGGSFDCDFILDAPVPIDGVLSYANTQNLLKSLPGLEGAEVRVFAIVDDIGDRANGNRNVAIGRVTADQMSNFMALISPSLRSGL